MTHPRDPHALLLQVMAHDLLAPLTAIKWQSELLANPKLGAEKRAEYIGTINRSSELGIALSKHAHTASRVLAEGYTGSRERGRLHAVTGSAADALKEQYARHGLSLTVLAKDEGNDRPVDKELTGFLVWLMAKYILTCAPAGSSVTLRGESASGHEGAYTLSMNASNVEGAEDRAAVFADDEPIDALDQSFVFSYLLRRTAPLVPCSISARARDKEITLDAVF